MRLLLLFAVLMIFGPAAAQTVEQDGPQDEYSVATERAQEIFLADQRAIEAAARCRHLDFLPTALDRMNEVIARDMVNASPQVSLGAARLLNLRQIAESDMDSAIWHQGCDGRDPGIALETYDARLAGAVTPAVGHE